MSPPRTTELIKTCEREMLWDPASEEGIAAGRSISASVDRSKEIDRDRPLSRIEPKNGIPIRPAHYDAGRLSSLRCPENTDSWKPRAKPRHFPVSRPGCLSIAGIERPQNTSVPLQQFSLLGTIERHRTPLVLRDLHGLAIAERVNANLTLH